MGKVKLDKAVPDFELPAGGGKRLGLAQLQGHNVVLYFYPKDNTTGCSLEAQDFRNHQAKFKRANTLIVGVSRDSLKSHDSFRQKYRLTFDLLSDENEKICRLFDVIKQKSLYGRKFMGIERSTFLIDAKGVLRREWRKVSVKGHAQEVLDAVKALA
ncbi:MAG: peroxiredoxin [Gammaproteobacteria bacterium]|nr:peroxiredoxin [Gammaproteobacteria bacterium]MBU6508579.1 peroxiredoxin [Gammaproteobacteria bacterium]MDE1983314.1 peroxiredoxin [Gammaproteobacteria bacterium]MDE2108828.1 peroxiredoxin [Gammaproteobacteria bacterium]MDE2461189.1 peroxiredoxin [Gammaproteobacteria bacterium]